MGLIIIMPLSSGAPAGDPNFGYKGTCDTACGGGTSCPCPQISMRFVVAAPSASASATSYVL